MRNIMLGLICLRDMSAASHCIQAGDFELVAAVKDSAGSAVRQRGACMAAAPVTARCGLDAADLQRRWSAGHAGRIRVLMADACVTLSVSRAQHMLVAVLSKVRLSSRRGCQNSSPFEVIGGSQWLEVTLRGT